MKKFVIIIDDGRVEDVISSSKEPMEFMIVDFDKKTLDRSVLEELRAPHDFKDVATLADMYHWDVAYDPKRVEEVFAEKRFSKSGL